MAEQEVFRGFFSYARHDGETDPGLITALTTELEGRINARLVNARWTIWLDMERLKIGERWNQTIDGELRSADVLIVLLTPRWIGSEYCRKEFIRFEQIEDSHDARRYVAPILARPIDQRLLTTEQSDILQRVREHQYFQLLATDFLRLPRSRRSAEIEQIAAHIVRMIEQLSTDKLTQYMAGVNERLRTEAGARGSDRGAEVGGRHSRPGDRPKARTVRKKGVKEQATKSDGPNSDPPYKCARTSVAGLCLKFYRNPRNGLYDLPPGGQRVDCTTCQHLFEPPSVDDQSAFRG